MPVEVTVYGMRRASYEAVTRAPGSFEQFRRGVDRLVAARVPFVLKGVVLPPNVRRDRRARALGGGRRWYDEPPGLVVLLDPRNRRDDAAKNAEIAALRLPPDEVVRVLTRREAEYRKEKAEFAARFMGPPGDRLFRCGAGQAVSVDAYGRAQPCMGVRAPELTVDLTGSDEDVPYAAGGRGQASGAIRPDSLSRARDAFASLKSRATNPEYLRRCARCFLRGTASSARRSRGASTAGWTRRSSTTATSPTPRLAI